MDLGFVGAGEPDRAEARRDSEYKGGDPGSDVLASQRMRGILGSTRTILLFERQLVRDALFAGAF